MKHKRAMFVVRPPSKTDPSDWDRYLRDNETWLTKYMVSVGCTMLVVIVIAYLIHKLTGM